MSNKKGEIATIITLGSLVVLGVVSLVSSVFLKKTSPIKTKASEDCNQMANRSCVNYPPPPPPVVRGQNKQDSTGACNPACCECNEQCPNGQKCDIPNGYCKSGFSCNPATGKKLTCVSGQCVWQACQGEDCNKNTCTSHSDCQPQSSPPASPPPGGGGGGGGGGGVGNSCFNIKAEFEVRPEGDKKAFYSWVTFASNKGGDIKLEYNGIHVAGWNSFGGGTFTYDPRWTQPHTHDHEAGIAAFSGKSHMPFTYRGMHSGCQPQDVTLSCAVGINDQGPYVTGEGCSCRNCQQYQSPPPTSRPTSPPTAIPTLPRGRGTPTPTPTTTLTPTLAAGKAGGPCISSSEHIIGGYYHYYYSCDGNLVCSKQDGTGICVTSTSTPTPTPLTYLPPTQQVIDHKGTVSFFIHFVNSQYYKDYVNFYIYEFLSGFSFLLKRETDCNLYNGLFLGCTYGESITHSSEGINIKYDGLDRYYSKDGISLTPNTFYFSAHYLGNLYEKRFDFQNYYQNSLTFSDLPSIDLAKYYRKISLRFAKNSQYLYEEGEKPIKLYIEPLPNNFSSIEKVNFDTEIDIIYISYYNFPPLPSKITIVPTYACGNISESETLTPNITIPESGTFDSTENDAGVITLSCIIPTPTP